MNYAQATRAWENSPNVRRGVHIVTLANETRLHKDPCGDFYLTYKSTRFLTLHDPKSQSARIHGLVSVHHSADRMVKRRIRQYGPTAAGAICGACLRPLTTRGDGTRVCPSAQCVNAGQVVR